MPPPKKNRFEDLVTKTNKEIVQTIAEMQERAKVEHARQKARQKARHQVEHARQKARHKAERAEGERLWAALKTTWKRPEFEKHTYKERAKARAKYSWKLSSEERAEREAAVVEALRVRNAIKQMDQAHYIETGRTPFYDDQRGIKRARSSFGKRVIKGRKRNLYFGSKGGVYYVSKGRKVYIQK